MEILEKAEPAIIFLAIILGLGLSDISILRNNSESLITLFLCLMLYGLFLEVPLKDLKKSFKDFKFTKTSLIINFIWITVTWILPRVTIFKRKYRYSNWIYHAYLNSMY